METLAHLGLSTFVCNGFIALLAWYHYKHNPAPSGSKYHTFWPRFWSPSVDEVVLWPLATVIPGIFLMLFPDNELLSNIIWLLSVMIWFAYSIYFHGRFGAPFGKMATKVRVVDARTERPISYVQAFLRDLPLLILMICLSIYYFVSAGDSTGQSLTYWSAINTLYIGWFIAEVVTMLTNHKRRAIHDFIAGTVVVRRELWEAEQMKKIIMNAAERSSQS